MKLETYKIIIEETIVGEFEIKAKSPEEAFEQASKNYQEGVFINEPGESQKTQIAVFKNNTLIIDFAEI